MQSTGGEPRTVNTASAFRRTFSSVDHRDGVRKRRRPRRGRLLVVGRLAVACQGGGSASRTRSGTSLPTSMRLPPRLARKAALAEGAQRDWSSRTEQCSCHQQTVTAREGAIKRQSLQLLRSRRWWHLSAGRPAVLQRCQSVARPRECRDSRSTLNRGAADGGKPPHKPTQQQAREAVPEQPSRPISALAQTATLNALRMC